MSATGATKWGILSAGKISHDFVSCLRTLDDHKVVAVAAKNVENAKKFAALHKIEKVLDNYEGLADLDVDVVYCGSLNTQHYPLVKMILSKGKPVLCEKPMTMSLKQTEELIEIARKNKIFLMEAMWSRFLPIYRDMIEKQLPKIGEVQQVHVAFGLKAIEGADRVTKADLGGSSILDIGIYAFNFAQMIFKDQFPIEVKAVGETNADGVDINTAIVLKYPNGKLASITTSVTTDLTCEALALGREGSIKLLKPFWCTDTMEVNGEKVHIPYPETAVPCNYDNSSGLRYEAMHVRECLLKGLTESPLMSLDVTRAFASLMESSMKQIGVRIKA